MTLPIPDGEFDAYIFDCDGTLADSMPLHYRAWCSALREHEAVFSEAVFYELGGTKTEDIVTILNQRHGYNMDAKRVARRKEDLFLELLSELAPIEPVVAIAREMSGRLPMAVASGGHRHVVRKCLDALGLTPLFQTIVCAEDYAKGKPAPDPFLEAARRLAVAPERCLVFEDTSTGEQAARAAGMKSVLVPPPARVVALQRDAALQ